MNIKDKILVSFLSHLDKENIPEDGKTGKNASFQLPAIGLNDMFILFPRPLKKI